MARKGAANYHNQMFLSLLQFVRTMSNASKIQLTDAIKSAKIYVADFSMKAAHRAKVKKLIPLMRAELKGFAPGRQINPRKKNPETEIRELILFSENSPSLHNQYVSIMKNLSRKKKRGVYDPVLAAKLWKYWIDEGVKQYNKEVLGGGYSLKQSVFTMQDRKQAAIEMEDQEQEGVFSMEYLELKNPRKKNPRKNQLWQVFKCKGNNLMFYMIPTPGSKAVHWSKDKRYGMAFSYKHLAERTAQQLANKMGTTYAIGITDYDSTVKEIKDACSGKV